MSDPVSVAGSAVGVISLGITACQGLLTYYSRFKSFHQEIADITHRIEDLHNILKLVEGVLDSHYVYETSVKAGCAKVGIDTVLRCERQIQELGKMLERFHDPSSTHSLESRLHMKMNRLIYPFRRDTLMALVETVSLLHANLDTALQMLNIAIGIASEQKMRTLATNSLSTSMHTGQVLGIVQRLEQTHAGLGRMLDTVEERLIQIESSIIRHGAQPILEPTALHSLVEKQEKINEDIGALSMGAQSLRGVFPNRRSTLCQNLHRNSIWGTSRESDERIVSLCKRWTFCNRILKLSVFASFNISRGAGGLAICPGLTISPIVPWDSPVFSLLDDVGYTLEGSYSSVTLQDTLKELLVYFQEGKASPSDTLPNGDTILHVVARWHVYAYRWDTPSHSEWRSFLNKLLDRGLPSNVPNHFGETPLDTIVRTTMRRGERPVEQVTIMICSDLFARESYITPRGFTGLQITLAYPETIWDYGWYSTHRRMQLVRHVAQQSSLSGIDIPEELMPLISESEHLLSVLLQRGIDMEWTLCFYTQWPKGLELLLQAGYAPDSATFRAAFDEETGTSVKLLIKPEWCWLNGKILSALADTANEHTKRLVVQEFAASRRRLQALAATYLPSKELERLKVCSEHLLGYQAAEVYKTLKSRAIEIGYIEEETGWFIYDRVGDDLKLADLLWDAGFRQVDEVDDDGYTSLMHITPLFAQHRNFSQILKKANWLISKGADVYRKKDSTMALHDLASSLGAIIYHAERNSEITAELHSLDEGSKDLMQLILADTTRDSCHCPCSRDGCSPLSRLLYGLCYVAQRDGLDVVVQRLARVVETMAVELEPKSPESFYSELAPCVLRFMTFCSLEIPHTCVCDERREISSAEVSEIQELYEKRYLELEQLQTEMLSEYSKSTAGLPKFLTGYWYTRIMEVLSTPELPEQEEIDQIRELGVILEL